MNLFCPKCEKPYEAEDEAAPCPDCGSEGLKPGPAKSALVVEFAAPASTQFNIVAHGVVTIAQLEVLAHDLLATAQYARWAQIHQAALQQQEEQEKEPKIAVPGMHPAQVADILGGMKE